MARRASSPESCDMIIFLFCALQLQLMDTRALVCISGFTFLIPPFLSWGGIFALARLTSGVPSQCLNFGPISEPGVNKGLGSLFSTFLRVCFSFFSFPCRSALGKLSLVRRETQNGPVAHLCRRRSSPLHFTGSPSLCWLLASYRAV